MRNVASWRRSLRALTAAVLILAAALLVAPSSASANGRGHTWCRHRVARHAYARVHRPRYRRAYYASYDRPYYYARYYRPRYRAVVVEDPYCYEGVTYVRPVYRSYYHHRHRPRVAVSLSFGSPGVYYGDPYCDW